MAPTHTRDARAATSCSTRRPPSLGVRLLADLRTLFTAASTGRMHTAEIITRLRAIDDDSRRRHRDRRTR
ncbi:DUF3631 domain-containing protein [Kibdelosporangium aridum]|uniref:DUF3631 domain-containing protein n=1 Tax=Kibdelosporangium aridum TaxID=2030 RepID=UPI001179DC80|nr:DUF3631 domain-containing protein [Kibdelosporangium aridum]